MVIPSSETPTVRVTNIPHTATANDLLRYLETTVGRSSVFALEIFSDYTNWKSRGVGRVQFETLEAKSKALTLAENKKLLLSSHFLCLDASSDDIIPRPALPRNRINNGALYAGFPIGPDCMSVLQSWEGVRGWVMPERQRLDFWVTHGDQCFKLEIPFENILECDGYCSDEGSKPNALLLKLRYGPRIYQKMAGPNVAAKFKDDRYRFCKENFEFMWVRTTDFSTLKSIGHSTSFFWEIVEESFDSDVFRSFPLYRENLKDLSLEDGEKFCSPTETVPLVKCRLDSKLPYESLFQLNSLVHTQKISLASVNDELIDLLASLDAETKAVIFQKLHKMNSTCN